jgi:RNA polymerase sigma-70 factor (ECF subfamily)
VDHGLARRGGRVALLVGGLEASVFAATSRARGREDVAWDDLVATVHRQMRTVAGTSRDLEDLTQVALEQIVRSLERFRGDGELATFTYRVCVNVALNHWRSYKRWFRRFTHEEPVEPICPEGSPSDMAIELERARRLYACLERLSPERRVVLTLADLEDLPASRIAEIVGSPEPTVRSRLRKARIELAALLAGDPAFAKDTDDETPNATGDEP